MTASLLIPPVAKFWGVDGEPLAFGKVYTYDAGTLTNKITYKTFDTGGAQNTNPVILDAMGEADIWLDGNYKINLTDADDVQIPNFPVDNVSSFSASNNFFITTGTANSYLLDPSPSLLSYSAGDTFNVEFNVGNSGPSTINISNLGAKSLVIAPATALSSGNLITGVIYTIVYDGTNFQVLNPTTVATVPPIFIQMSAQPTAPAGYLPMDSSTIAKTSGGTYNGVIYSALYTYLWTYYDDTAAPVSSGRGGSAAGDFAANKNIGIPDRRGYSPMGIKTATALTTASAVAGTLTVQSTGTNNTGTSGATTLSIPQIPGHTHDIDAYSGSDVATNRVAINVKDTPNTISAAARSTGGGGSHTHTTPAPTFTGDSTSVLHPVFGVYYYINY